MGLHWGTFSVYGGGGYYLDLSGNRAEAAAELDDLFNQLWIDRGTRAVFIHLTVFNPNVNLFCVVS